MLTVSRRFGVLTTEQVCFLTELDENGLCRNYLINHESVQCKSVQHVVLRSFFLLCIRCRRRPFPNILFAKLCCNVCNACLIVIIVRNDSIFRWLIGSKSVETFFWGNNI